MLPPLTSTNSELRAKPCCARGPKPPNWGKQTGIPPLHCVSCWAHALPEVYLVEACLIENALAGSKIALHTYHGNIQSWPMQGTHMIL